MFSRATVVVGPHGAALTGIIFAAPGTVPPPAVSPPPGVL
jgi:hypothetical protein